jgi:hypothetical protein
MHDIINQVQKMVDQEESRPAIAQLNQRKHHKSRWAILSEEIKKDPPLRGLGDYVRKCSK